MVSEDQESYSSTKPLVPDYSMMAEKMRWSAITNGIIRSTFKLSTNVPS